MNAALDAVSTHLGNTRTVCRKYYVHPSIITLFEEKKLSKFFEKGGGSKDFRGMEPEEKVLMRVLESQKSAVSV